MPHPCLGLGGDKPKPVEYVILENPTLVFICYFGHIKQSDVRSTLTQFAKEGRHYIWQPNLFDFSHVTIYDIDYTDFFKTLGPLAEVYPQSAGEHFFAFYAPDGIAAKLAEQMRKP